MGSRFGIVFPADGVGDYSSVTVLPKPPKGDLRELGSLPAKRQGSGRFNDGRYHLRLMINMAIIHIHGISIDCCTAC